MPILKRRTRTVIFRLTEDEYDQLKTALVTHGARNVSDFARTELLKSVAGDRQEMTQKLAQIESSVQRLEQLMTGIVTRDTLTHN